jgi:hypothetical protein
MKLHKTRKNLKICNGTVASIGERLFVLLSKSPESLCAFASLPEKRELPFGNAQVWGLFFEIFL